MKTALGDTDRRRSPTEIEGEIARTRAELGLTLDALTPKLAPRRLLEEGIDMITSSLPANRPGGINLGGGFRADPIAIALMGLGAAWLLAGNTDLLIGLFQPGAGPTGERPGAATADSTARGAERIVGRTGAPAIDAGQGGQTDGWVHQATDAARGALRSIRDGSEAVLERAGEYIDVGQTGERARAAGSQLIETLQRNPLLLGLAGLAAGAAVAVLVPSLRREQEVVGQAREDLWEMAEDLGHRTAACVRGMADAPTDSTGRS